MKESRRQAPVFKSGLGFERSGGSLNKHQQRTEATRRKLLKSARRIFARDGFEGARLEEIANEAGHTRGAFYAHFKSKEDLFFALLDQQIREHIQNIQRLMESCRNPEARLAALREYYVQRIADRQWVMLMLEFKLFALRRSALRAKLAEAHRRIRSSVKADLLGKLLPARLQRTPETDELRRTALEAALHGLVLEHAYDPKRISEEQVASILRRIFDMLMER
ncbi:MAG: TetR/AcrR family transcriptional regulator [Acidobacteriaceae bacterium]|nr:TetR/AcrR family transcriptional regulator [Acidobacteriaceae bacterium]